MANPEHVEIVRKGAAAIAAWREGTPGTPLELTGSDLSDVDLTGTNLAGAQLNGAKMDGVILVNANLFGANLRGANLRRANLCGADLSFATLGDADLNGANIVLASLNGANLSGADLNGARCALTTFGNANLADAKGLEKVKHVAPSEIGIYTLLKSQGNLPYAFLQGCGFQRWQVLDAKLYDPDLSAAAITDLQSKIFEARTSGPLMLGGVFISYAHEDAGFVDKIRSKLIEKGVSVWLDRHDLVAGPLQEQIDRAVRLNDVVLLVLSKASIESDWVEHEVKTARKIERETARDVLCPVSLDDAWKDKVTDVLWEHLEKKYILDFRKWKTKAFDDQFDKLLKGLKIYYEKPKE